MPTWLIIAIAVVYLCWSVVEINGAITYWNLKDQGYKVYYRTLSKMITYLWLITTVVILCWLIFG